MPLFEPPRPSEDEDFLGSDAATRALSATAVENDFITGVYEKLSSVYDYTFGPALQAGRIRAIQRMGIRQGDRILEVGTGTGIAIGRYPGHCSVTGIDLSSSMLEKARARVARKGITNVRLVEMDAADLKFDDGAFDVVYGPYLINCVTDPLTVAREMRRVCRPGGRIIFLNHFRSQNALVASLERALTPLTVHIGFKSDFDMRAFLAQAELKPVSIEKVSVRLWSLVTCIKE